MEDLPSDVWQPSRERRFPVPYSQNYDYRSQHADVISDYQVWSQRPFLAGVEQSFAHDTCEPNPYGTVQPTHVFSPDGSRASVAAEGTYSSVTTLGYFASGQSALDELSTSYHQVGGNECQPHLAVNNVATDSSLLYPMEGPVHVSENEWPNYSSPSWLRHLSEPVPQPPSAFSESPASLKYPTTHSYQVEPHLSTTQHGIPLPPFSGSTSRSYSCQWIGSAQALPCNVTLTGDIKDLRDHLRAGHRFRCTGTNVVRCSWANCEQFLRRDNVARHIISRHLQVKVFCTACGMELCRNDVRYAHGRRCHAALQTAASQSAGLVTG
ncbi:hypothetical protein F5I97DRAFT_701014 [Phlebopus sp. FC_14]|nr:hypothetical protein F5I97DRAFT_701014 [Phlebopus sp. FC_14]